MFRRAHGAGFDRELALFHNPVRGFLHHLLEQHAQMRVPPIISRRDVFHPVGVGGELIAFFETNTRRIVRIIDRDRLSAVFLHYGEAWHVGRPVADVNHIGEWNRSNFRIHVIIHVLRHVEEAFINAKEKLRLLGVTDDALRESDAAFGICGELASENGAQIRREPAAIDQYLHAR